MSVVQRLTGLSSSLAAADSSAAGDLSPAARLATIEKASPRPEREREREIDVSDMMMEMADVSVELGQVPGILSPAPASLAPIPSGFFSPAAFELSPHWPASSFLASPSALLSAPLVSPISPPNFYNNLFDLLS